MLKLSKLVKMLHFLCQERKSQNGTGVSLDYVREHFRAARPRIRGHANTQAIFTLVAVKDDVATHKKRIVGYAQCTVYTRLGGVGTERVVKLDLLCTQSNPKHGGAGAVLMDELEIYARQHLGANILVLDSVPSNNTWQFYMKRGFTRARDACADPNPVEEPGRDEFVRSFLYPGQTSMPRPMILPRPMIKANSNYMDAMQGAYIHGLNLKIPYRPKKRENLYRNFGNTVFMSKCIRRADGIPAAPNRDLLVRYASSQSRYSRSESEYATFKRPGVRLLAVYGPVTPAFPRLPRLQVNLGTTQHPSIDQINTVIIPHSTNNNNNKRQSPPPAITTPPIPSNRQARPLRRQRTWSPPSR